MTQLADGSRNDYMHINDAFVLRCGLGTCASVTFLRRWMKLWSTRKWTQEEAVRRNWTKYTKNTFTSGLYVGPISLFSTTVQIWWNLLAAPRVHREFSLVTSSIWTIWSFMQVKRRIFRSSYEYWLKWPRPTVSRSTSKNVQKFTMSSVRLQKKRQTLTDQLYCFLIRVSDYLVTELGLRIEPDASK